MGLILYYTYKQLRKRYECMSATDYSRSYREPYELAANWMKTLCNTEASGTRALKKELRSVEKELERLTKLQVELKESLKVHCKHPVHKLHHNGFAMSNGETFSELVECQQCGKRWYRNEVAIPPNFYV